MNKENLDTLCMSCMQHTLAPNGFCSNCGVNEGAIWSAPHHLRPRSVLSGRYIVGKTLGEGGFGITYVGWDTHISVKVAIKEYYPSGCVTRDVTNGSTVYSYGGNKGDYFKMERQRFMEEARRLSRFHDLPGIVSVKDFFEENSTAYIVMEFVEGATLKTVLANMNGRMPEEHVLQMMKPLIKSLAEIHESGIIHRDIAPDNIMIRPDGSVKLIDFGAAREAEADGKSNVALMKHGYTPEEQYDTDRSRQGPWSDVYALCATIFRSIEGVTPPDANTRLRQDTFAGFSVPVSENTQHIIIKGLSVKPEQRWQNMGELSRELYSTTVAQGAAAVATPGTTVAQAAPHQPLSADVSSVSASGAKNMKWFKPVAIGVGGLVALVLIIIGIASLVNKTAPIKPDDTPNTLVDTSPIDNSQITQPSTAAKTPETTPDLPQDSSIVGNVCANLMQINGGFAVESDGWVYYNDFSERSLKRMKTDGSENMELSSDSGYYINVIGDWVYYANYDGIKKIKTDGSNEQTLTDFNCSNIYVVGEWIYYLNGEEHERLYKMKTDGTNTVKLTEDMDINRYFVVGDLIYYQRDYEWDTIWKIKAADGSGKVKLPLDDDEYYNEMNVIGEWIYYSRYGGLYKIKTDGSEETLVFATDSHSPNSVVVLDGWIYYADDYNYGGYNYSRVKIDGSENMQLISDYGIYSSDVNVSGDWVYYKADYYDLYRIRTDGSIGPITMDGQVIEVDANSLKSSSEFYEEWPDLPDFGYVCSIQLLKKQVEGNAMFYVYDLYSASSFGFGISITTYNLKLGNNGFSGNIFNNMNDEDEQNSYFANEDGTGFYFFIDTVDDQLCPIIYAFRGEDSFAHKKATNSNTPYPVYVGSSVPDFGVAFGVSVAKETIDANANATLYTYNKSLFSVSLIQDFVDRYAKILEDDGFSKSSGKGTVYRKSGTSVEIRDINTTSSTFTIVVYK